MADSAPAKPPTRVELIWEHDLVFGGHTGSVPVTLDSASAVGPSPVQSLALGLAGCMAMDLVHILRKARLDLKGLKADLLAQRSPEIPHRFTAVTLHFTVTGEVPLDQVQRAIDLSHDKYCSVWHSMRQDIDFDVTFKVTAAV